MDKRQKLIASVIGPEMDDTKLKMLNETLKLILGDMGEQYCKFWDAEGPGVLCLQPQHERSVFFMTLKELKKAMDDFESNKEMHNTFEKIIQAAQKINPLEKAGYVINDSDGIRYLEIEYDKAQETLLG